MLEQRTWVEGERNKQIGLLNSPPQFDYILTTLASFTGPNVSFGVRRGKAQTEQMFSALHQ